MQKFLLTQISTDCLEKEFLNDYISLIKSAAEQNRSLLDKQDVNYIYYEKHHILPRSLYKDFIKEPANIVLLTAREHYLAHKYLAAMFPNTNLVFAFWRLSTDKKGRHITIDEYEEARLLVAKKTKEINTGKKQTPEAIEKARLARLGGKHTAETKAKISKAHKGRKLSEATRKKISKAKVGKPAHEWTEASRQQLSEQRKGQGNPMFGKNVKDYMSEEAYEQYKQKLSAALLGHKVSEETRRKIGENSAARCKGAGNPRARKVLCIEDNIVFGTISEMGDYFGHSRNWATRILKAGYSKEFNKHFKFLDKEDII